MKPIEERIKQHEFTSYAAFDSLEAIWSRVEPLVTGPRLMIYIERWVPSVGELKVVTGLSLETRGFRPGAHFHKDSEATNFHVILTPGINALGASGWKPDGTELDAAHRFTGDKKDATRIRVGGVGNSGHDFIEVTDYNEHGVGFQRCLYFQVESDERRAESEAQLFEGMASRGDWPAADLSRLADRTRYYREPALWVAAEEKLPTSPEVQR